MLTDLVEALVLVPAGAALGIALAQELMGSQQPSDPGEKT